MATAARLWAPALGLALCLYSSVATAATPGGADTLLPPAVAQNGSTLLITEFGADASFTPAPSTSLAGTRPEPASAGVLILGAAALATRFRRTRRAAF
jgi:hypothetical protein